MNQETKSREKVYVPNEPETKAIKYKDSIGKHVGNFIILDTVGDSKVKALCTLCSNDQYITRWHKIKTGHSTSCGCKHKLKNPESHIGKKYNMLTVTRINPNKDKDGAVLADVKCDCGNLSTKRLNTVIRGKIKSCGCLNKTRDGLSSSGDTKRFMDIWYQMMKRCYQKGGHVTDNPKLQFLNKEQPHPRYKDYGARGIYVDKRWHDPKTFVSWYTRNIRDHETMDRINNDGPYGPDNCMSNTILRQNFNQRVRKDNKYDYKGIINNGHSFGWTVGLNGKKYKKEGYKSAEDALLDRNLFIVENDFPNPIQPIKKKHELKTQYNSRTDGYHLAALNGLDIFAMSNRFYSKRHNKTLVKTLELMTEASNKKV